MIAIMNDRHNCIILDACQIYTGRAGDEYTIRVVSASTQNSGAVVAQYPTKEERDMAFKIMGNTIMGAGNKENLMIIPPTSEKVRAQIAHTEKHKKNGGVYKNHGGS